MFSPSLSCSHMKASATEVCCLIKHRNLWKLETWVLSKYLTVMCVCVSAQRPKRISYLNNQPCRKGCRALKRRTTTVTPQVRDAVYSTGLVGSSWSHTIGQFWPYGLTTHNDVVDRLFALSKPNAITPRFPNKILSITAIIGFSSSCKSGCGIGQ